MQETSVQKRVWLALGSLCRLFRVNTGRGWVQGRGNVKRLPDGSVIVPNARPLSLGLTTADGKPLVGTSDLIGLTPIQITLEMVGHTVAVFTVIECKESDGGVTTPEQKNFIDTVKTNGGIAGVVHDPEKSKEIISDYFLKFRQRVI